MCCFYNHLKPITARIASDVAVNDSFYDTVIGQDPVKVYGLEKNPRIIVSTCAMSCRAYHTIAGRLKLNPKVAGYNVDNVTLNLTKFNEIYALMQCTPDLSEIDCVSCLHQNVTRFKICCDGKEECYVYKPSCLFRRDLNPSYSVTTVDFSVQQSTNTTAVNGSLYDTVIGQDLVKVYGLGVCRGDSTSEVCNTFVNNTVQHIIASCLNQKMWFHRDKIDPRYIVLYADHPIVGKLKLNPEVTGYNVDNVTLNLTKFNKV
ncbi:hypothetical protein Ddye_028173 [Dipteronia dyeriana]|uniref:Gnk2-homologous domain-containing protein n=1 Tax=Dipteronia dyeriana TaxID=168575 RepID=A0AAD9TR03_9ROSI|nr:hypothetical protein Ddye_028173 [Dipteronia dyeriana]